MINCGWLRRLASINYDELNNFKSFKAGKAQVFDIKLIAVIIFKATLLKSNECQMQSQITRS